jgi:hypothetical protein
LKRGRKIKEGRKKERMEGRKTKEGRPRKGQKDGKKEGQKEGRKEGRTDGRKDGRKEGHLFGAAYVVFTLAMAQAAVLSPTPREECSALGEACRMKVSCTHH